MTNLNRPDYDPELIQRLEDEAKTARACAIQAALSLAVRRFRRLFQWKAAGVLRLR